MAEPRMMQPPYLSGSGVVWGGHAEAPHPESTSCAITPACVPYIEPTPEPDILYFNSVEEAANAWAGDAALGQAKRANNAAGRWSVEWDDGSVTQYRVGIKPEDRVDTTTPRASALNEARDLITGDRNNQYGPPTQDFARTADLLNALGYRRLDAEDIVHDVLPSDVALIIAQVKVSRLMHTRHKRDSWVDLAGYAACGYECAVEESKENEK